jgi:divalent metal cation (Fe/Co/Zn/Cd) transporter
MNDQLAFTITQWHDFFIAAAGAGAVLLGLVFIGLTIHLEGREEKPALVPLAVDSATTLFYPVVISLVMLMPPMQPWLPSLGLLVVALFAALSASAPLVQSQLRRLWIDQATINDRVRYVVPAVASVALIGAAIWLMVDVVIALYAIGLVIGIYLVVGVQSAWNLLLAGRFDVGAWSVTRVEDKAGDERSQPPRRDEP